ncbi:ArsC family reductase [Acidovorax sp. NCPPB 2350]|nr:ArsC family reductase [Acidovorax sp. NCPPB 2350]
MIAAMSTLHPIVYGIPNCDTVKKARAWLAERGIEYRFHDFKKQGVPADRLAAWMASAGWETLVNRQGTTWRKIDPAAQASVRDAASAAALLQAQPSAIKRPVVEWSGDAAGEVTVGFQDARWNERLAAASKP